MLSAGMAFEDGAVLGECLSRLPNSRGVYKTSPEYLQSKRHALSVFEKCRKQRTKMVVDRGNVQQYLYHLHDGPEQEERDRKMQMVPTPEGEALAWRDPGLAPKLLGYDHIADVSQAEVVELANHELTKQVDLNWNVEDESEGIAVYRL
jgi:salicylate hydroxylase